MASAQHHPSSRNSLPIAIAGGGVAGLALAIALGQNGQHAVLYEQAAQFTDIGAGIQLTPNAVQALRHLGVMEDALAMGDRAERLVMRDARTGRVVFSMGLGKTAIARWGAPWLHIHRADLIALLEKKARSSPHIALHLGQKIADIHDDGDVVRAELSNGDEAKARALYLADGVHSDLRKKLGNIGGHARHRGQFAWRALAPSAMVRAQMPDDMHDGDVTIWTGAHLHIVTYGLRHGALINCAAVIERPNQIVKNEQRHDWMMRGKTEDALRQFSATHPFVKSLLTASEQLYCWPLFEMPPLKNWHRGHIAALGDAAHPMLPYMAQGAAMALEDAVFLGGGHAKMGHVIEPIFAGFAQSRGQRVKRVQSAARGNAGYFHIANPMARGLRNIALKAMGGFNPAVFAERLDWLYGYDAARQAEKIFSHDATGAK